MRVNRYTHFIIACKRFDWTMHIDKRTCPTCGRVFVNRMTLKAHSRRIHNIEVFDAPRKSLICLLCESGFTSFFKYKEHLTLEHEINLKTEELEFKTLEECYRWKEGVENLDRVNFVKTTGTQKLIGYKNMDFRCNRSGHYKTSVGPDERKRRFRKRGSCKINGMCPARIQVRIYANSVKVEFWPIHLGHAPDLAHKTLSKDERKMIALKIANRVPFSTILNEAKSTVTLSESMSRIHLLRRQDLHNIARDFGLQCEKELDMNDSNDNMQLDYDDTSVDEWILNNTLTNDSTLLLEPVFQELDAMNAIENVLETPHRNNCQLLDATSDNRSPFRKPSPGNKCQLLDATSENRSQIRKPPPRNKCQLLDEIPNINISPSEIPKTTISNKRLLVDPMSNNITANRKRIQQVLASNKRLVLKSRRFMHMFQKCQLVESDRRRVERLLDSLLQICSSSVPSKLRSVPTLKVDTGKKIEKQKLSPEISAVNISNQAMPSSLCSSQMSPAKKKRKESQSKNATEVPVLTHNKLIPNKEVVFVHTGFDHQYY